eukprot:TRINITY_DN9615_c0_g1_i1.p1 TRINITY_DN9615_c0_g1~~TRINITY_DN9615_c0_g1_i1.p1  ORF type:complete len:226 (+),score=34.54 TRINITY_DN9615_c0_g1_i1:816-1493(+)
MKRFVDSHPGILGLTISSREDSILDLLANRHGNRIKQLYLETCEGTTCAGLIFFLKQCVALENLYMSSQDVTLLNQELFDTISGLSMLSQLKIICADRAHGPLRIHHPTVTNLNLSKFVVDSIIVDFPNVVRFVPPVDIKNRQQSTEIYRASFPRAFMICVRVGNLLKTFKISPHETVSELEKIVKRKFGIPPGSGKLICNGKFLHPHSPCSELLKSGDLVHMLV